MRIMTWNINSVRLRAPLLLQAMAQLQPDVVALQETKCPDELFPTQTFAYAGYAHQHISGMKSYNGVAILSRLPLHDPRIHNRVGRADCRHISACIKRPSGGQSVEIHNIYIPAGGDIPDPHVNEKFEHKLGFVRDVTQFFGSSEAGRIVVGDFNIAPLEHDVWSHKQLLDVVSHTPVEVEHLAAFQQSAAWVDAVRHFVPQDQKCYTWWSYRNQDWRKSNRGRRLDHIWVTPDLAPHLKGHEILVDARDWPQTSDHVPVLVELDV